VFTLRKFLFQQPWAQVLLLISQCTCSFLAGTVSPAGSAVFLLDLVCDNMSLLLFLTIRSDDEDLTAE
jgi:hypothetical protein